MLHYLRTTRDGRIAFGWGGGRMGFGGRQRSAGSSVDPRRGRARSHATSCASSRSCADRAVTHAWGGPIDVSPTHLPIFGSRGRVHHGFGFTGNGVGPSYLGGEILARLALDRRDALTRLAIVEPDRKLVPARAAALGRRLADQARARPRATRPRTRVVRADPRHGLIASLPRRLGLHLPR